MCAKMRVLYPHHPLHQQELSVLQAPRRNDGCLLVRRPDGVDLKVPAWMFEPAAAAAAIREQPSLDAATLRAVLAVAPTLSKIAADGDEPAR